MHVVPRVVQNSPFSFAGKLTAAHRLSRKTGFDHVMQAENIADKHFKVFFSRNGNKNAKLGILVPKRTLSSAVDRNRTKRIIRDIFRQHCIKLCHLDIVVMLRRFYPDSHSSQVNSLKMLLSKVENRCAKSSSD